jgi:hypothetical protein
MKAAKVESGVWLNIWYRVRAWIRFEIKAGRKSGEWYIAETMFSTTTDLKNSSE